MPALLNWGLTQILAQQGMTNVAVRIGNVGATQAWVDQIEFTYAEQDTSLRVQLGKIHLDYTVSQLLLGQAEKLLINKVAIKLDHRTSSQASTLIEMPSIDVLLRAYNSVDPTSFPVNILRLPDISILHNLASESVDTFDEVELIAQINKLENGLRAGVSSTNQAALTVESDEGNGWHIKFFDASSESKGDHQLALLKPVLKGSLNRVKQSLEFSVEVDSKFDRSWLPVSHQLDNFADFSELTVKGTLESKEDKSGLALSSSILIQDLSYRDYSLQSLNAQLKTQITQAIEEGKDEQEFLSFEIASRNTVSINRLSFAEWQTDSIIFTGNSEVSLADGMTNIAISDLLVTIDKLQGENGLELSDLSFTGTVSAAIQPESWSVGLAEPWQLVSKYGRLDNIELPQGLVLSSDKSLRLHGALTSSLAGHSQASLQAAKAENSLMLEKVALDITVPVVRDKSFPLHARIGNMSLQINPSNLASDPLDVDGLLSISQLTLVDALTTQLENGYKTSENLELDNIEQAFTLKRDLLTSRGALHSIARDLHIETTSQHSFDKQQGDTEFRVKAIDLKNAKQLHTLLSPFTMPVKLVTGKLDLSAQVDWAQKRDQWQTKLNIDAQLNDLGGAYDEIFFSGVNGDLSLQVYPQIVSNSPHKITINNVDMGVTSSDALVEFTLQPSPLGNLPMLNITQAQMLILQGSMGLKPGLFDLNQEQKNAIVTLENIDLSELVRLHQLEDIQATGRITGQLPVVLNGDQISIDDGQLQAIAPGGTLKYLANDDALKANKYAETVVSALENFNYDVLRADTQYSPDGTLLLGLRLQGNNPEYENGRPVNLNINLEQNVLKLFESIRLIEGVSGSLDKRVQDFYQK